VFLRSFVLGEDGHELTISVREKRARFLVSCAVRARFLVPCAGSAQPEQNNTSRCPYQAESRELPTELKKGGTMFIMKESFLIRGAFL
ncbi:MAG: hypothetical protein IIY28_13135, partial [Lachnospiraceae bacterium]|nr:hypothetical protein [Lachnospiraceae bacterium]